MDPLQHESLELLVILDLPQVQSVLHVELIVLIHPNQPLNDVTRVKVHRVHEEVLRVGLLHIGVQVVDRHGAEKPELSLLFDVVMDDLEDAVKVLLCDDAESTLGLVIGFPSHARED